MNKNNLTINKQLSLYAFPAILVLLVMVIIVIGIKPSFERILFTQSEITKQEARLAKLEQKVDVLSKIDESDIKANVDKLLNVLPAYKSIPGLLSGLERLAAEASASVEAFSVSPGKISTVSSAIASGSADVPSQNDLTPISAASGVPSVNFAITLSSNFTSLKLFLGKLETIARIMGVSSISFSSSANKSANDLLSTTISLRAYYLPYPLTLGAIDDKVETLTPTDKKVFDLVTTYDLYTITPSYEPTGKTDPFKRF